jgi:hypothetical protein
MQQNTPMPTPTTPTTPTFETLWHDDLARAAPPRIPWLWHGFLAPGNVTLLTGQWKCGKTTLLAALLSRLGAGGQLAGLTVTPAKAAVVTEEGPELWQRRGEQFAETPRQLVVELNAAGTDFVALGDVADVEFDERWQQLRPVFTAAPHKLTRRGVQLRWPPDLPRIDQATLWRWLDRAVTQGLLRRAGAGRRNDPYRFWLPERDEELSEDLAVWLERLKREAEAKPPGGQSNA